MLIRLKNIGKITCDDILDFGCNSEESCDYPDFAHKLCENLADGRDRGILICGSGIGMSIVANRYKHIRCALCNDINTLYSAQEHNDANVLAMGARKINEETVMQMANCFISNNFYLEERHRRRIKKINQ